MAAQENELKSSTWKLPKGKSMELITWRYTIEQLAYLINGLVEEETKINAAIVRINNKLDEWIDQEG